MRSYPLFHRIIAILNLLWVLGTFLSYLAPWVNPASFWPIAFFGLAHPVFFLGNLLFLLYWILFRKRFFFVPLLTLLLGFYQHKAFFNISLGSEPIENASEPIKVMSFNVRLFGLYEWGTNKETRDATFRFLRAEQPDIAGFQEFFYSSEEGYFDTRDPMLDFLDADEFHDAYAHQAGKKHYFGIATFSRYPILDRGQVQLPKKQQNICIYTDLLMEGDTIRVYNGHLASIRTRGESFDTYSGARSILSKLKRAFIARGEQVDLLVKHIQDCPHPVVLLCDLNDTPGSYAYHRLSSVLEDSFKKSGNGMGRTYNGDMPSFRIDHIFHSSEFHSFDHEVTPEELSDHYPVQSKLQLRKEE